MICKDAEVAYFEQLCFVVQYAISAMVMFASSSGAHFSSMFVYLDDSIMVSIGLA